MLRRCKIPLVALLAPGICRPLIVRRSTHGWCLATKSLLSCAVSEAVHQTVHCIATIRHCKSRRPLQRCSMQCAALDNDADQPRSKYKPRVAPHNDSSQVLNCIHPVRGIRDLMMRCAQHQRTSSSTILFWVPHDRQGIRPPNHMAHNRAAIIRKSDENKQRKQGTYPAPQPSKPKPAPRCVANRSVRHTV